MALKNRHQAWDVLLNGNNMTDEQNFIKEIDQEVREDNYKRAWNKYKKYIFSIIIIILTITASFNLYKHNKDKKIAKQSELFFEAIKYIEENDYGKAEKIFKEINNSQASGYSDLSILYLFDLFNKKEISSDLKDYKVKKNSLFYGLIKLQKFNYEIESDIENISNLDEIVALSKPTSPWKYISHELLSSYYLKKNDTDNALQSLNTIIDSEDSGELLKERSKTLIEMINKKK